MTVSIAALITVNLIPLIGVLFNDWDAGLLLLLYGVKTSSLKATTR